MSTSGIQAVASATQTNYPVLVNGYECYTAAAVQAARDFENPNATASGTTTAAAGGTGASALSAAGKRHHHRLNQAANAVSNDQAAGVNQPLKTGTRGVVVNILV